MPFLGVCCATVRTIGASGGIPSSSLKAAPRSGSTRKKSLSTPFGIRVVGMWGSIARISSSQDSEMVMIWSNEP